LDIKMFKDAKSIRIQAREESHRFGTIFQANGYAVGIRKAPGRRLISCTCRNGSNNLPTAICKHKIKAIVTEYCLQNGLTLVPLEKK